MSHLALAPGTPPHPTRLAIRVKHLAHKTLLDGLHASFKMVVETKVKNSELGNLSILLDILSSLYRINDTK